MFDYYLTLFDEDIPAIYRVHKITKEITYATFKDLNKYGWERTCCILAQLENNAEGFERLR